MEHMSETNFFHPRLTSFGVSAFGASFMYDTFAAALKAKYSTFTGQGEIKGHLTVIGAFDIDGAFLYDGSTWAEAEDGYLRPAVVNGIEYLTL